MEKEYIYPDVGDRSSPKEWLEQGSTDVLQRAHKRVADILREYYPSHISEATDEALRKMLAVKLPRGNMRSGNDRWK
jgi:trimethylamine--corrinoid protein Co-methyltransferase